MRGAAIFAALVSLTPMTAAALDCAAPPNAFLRNTCASPQAMRAWQDMEQALTAALAATPDPAGKAAIRATQDRWLAIMGGWNVDATRTAFADGEPKDSIDYFEETWGWRPKDATEAELLWQIRYRADVLPRLPAAFAELRDLRKQFSGGPFSISATGCFYLEPENTRNRSSDRFCGGTVSLQNDSRVCSVTDYWYSGHINTVYSVDDVVDGKLVHRGNCDFNGMAPDCPIEYSLPEDNAHWDPQVSRDVEDIRNDILAATREPVSPLRFIDPESWLTIEPYPQDWLATCLTTPDYPPPDQLWPGLGPKPTP